MSTLVAFFSTDRFYIYRNIAAVIGLGYVLKVTLHHLWLLSKVVWAYVAAPCAGLTNVDMNKFGEWAVITGASEGIGRGYALEMARRGLNVVLISRSEEKLKKVEDEIRTKYNREVLIIPIDFTDGQKVYSVIRAEISHLDVGVLVNNVGIGIQGARFFHTVDEMRHRNVIELSCQAMVQMTHLILPQMIEKNKGIIVNISSTTAVLPFPLTSVYSSSKEFMRYFTTALQTEYKSKGIIVQCVYPGYVATAMTGLKPRWWSPDPLDYTRAASATIGILQHTYGYIPHAIQGYVLEVLWSLFPSRLIQNLIMSYMYKRTKNSLKNKNN